MTPTPLGHWLDAVTAPFPPDTARRIRRELEEHALAHAEALREAGYPYPEGAALAALGSATQVQHALLQTHFTRAEEDELHANRAYQKADVRGLSGLALDAVFGLALPLMALLVGWSFSWGAYGVYVTGVVLLSAGEWAIPRRWPGRSARVLLGLMRALRSLFVMLSLYAIWLSNDASLWAGVVGVALGAGTVHLTRLRPLWHHVPKALRGAR